MLRVCALMGVLGMATLVLADPPAATPTSDLDKLQGYWKPLQCDYEGKPQMPTDIMKQVTVVFDKSEYHLYFKDKEPDKYGKPVILRLALANVALDAATKTITFEFADGPLKGKKSHGIYEVAGNQLKMCYGPVEKPKPTRFESPAGSGYFLETWARQQK
ncbi:MAG: TIGR03067 domain-containing protein [Planctomycetes bacterium]|nr:TIGR03067 domain-containing protein [Planctomycetota bacterium]